jgi:hypothetical protein
VANVLANPLSMETRARLGQAFAADGQDRLAREQFDMVADLTDGSARETACNDENASTAKSGAVFGGHVPLSRGSLTVSGPRDLRVLRSSPSAYCPDGSLATATLRPLRGEGLELRRVTMMLPDRDVVRVCEREVVWGGDLAAEFGRFLAESVMRLWSLLPGEELEGLPVVFTAPFSDPRLALEWLQAFGVRTVALPESGAVRFTRMFLPEPAWRHGAWIAPEIRDIHLRARAGLEIPTLPSHDVLWLSRAGLNRPHIAYDEGLLEWILGGRLTVIRPETMTLAEQVAALEGSRAVAGVIGSAFHTLLLTEKTPDCLYLCSAWPKEAFPAQHRLLAGQPNFSPSLTFPAGVRRVRELILVKRKERAFFPRGYLISIPRALRAFSEALLPTLLEDSRMAAFARSDVQPAERSHRVFDSELDVAVANVLANPLSMETRARLGQAFAADGQDRLAREQFDMVADLTQAE